MFFILFTPWNTESLDPFNGGSQCISNNTHREERWARWISVDFPPWVFHGGVNKTRGGFYKSTMEKDIIEKV